MLFLFLFLFFFTHIPFNTLLRIVLFSCLHLPFSDLFIAFPSIEKGYGNSQTSIHNDLVVAVGLIIIEAIDESFNRSFFFRHRRSRYKNAHHISTSMLQDILPYLIISIILYPGIRPDERSRRTKLEILYTEILEQKMAVGRSVGVHLLTEFSERGVSSAARNGLFRIGMLAVCYV